MNPGNWERVKSLFRQALEQPESARASWLERECGGDAQLLARVQRLLDARNAQAPILADDALALLGRLLPDTDTTAEQLGTSIGPYRLLRLLGEGGMGRVYLADRADGQFQQQVALKLIRSEFATPALHERFLRERDTLARLKHPQIAPLHDGGMSTEGSPYFTLEYVAGTPITRWCDERRLDLRARIHLLLKVCDAVEYAHRNLIVHRDLKPSNILVTEAGEAKLLDFGIAKLLPGGGEAELTATQARPMTREYAAPEQVLGEPITTATDVYGLGLLLYILLCGRMPYRRAALGESGWTKAIITESAEPLERALSRAGAGAAADNPPHATSLIDPTTIAAARGVAQKTLQHALRGDLERIIQRALAKAPEARYTTVGAFADDLRAFLDGRAISGGTRTYRLRKFIRRRWLPLSAATAFLLLIVGGAFVFAAQARQTEREARTSAAVKDFVLELFRNANPAINKGKQVTLRDVVDRGVRRLESIPPEQPELRAELQNTLGTIRFQLGDYKEAAELHGAAFAAVRSLGQSARLAASAERLQATDLASLGDLAGAQRLADDAVARLRTLTPPPVRDLARALSTAGWVAKKRSDPKRARELGDEAFALASAPPGDDEVLFLALTQKGTAAKMAHEYPAAIENYERALAISTRLYGRDDQDTIATEQLLGTALNNIGSFEAAEKHLQAAVESAQRVFGEGNSRTLRVGEMQALNEFECGDVKTALAHFDRLVGLVAAGVPKDEGLLAELQLNHAEVLTQFGNAEAAQTELVGVRDYLRQHGGDAGELAETMSALGYAHYLAGELDVAESEQREALAALTALHDEDLAAVLMHLSEIELRRGDTAAALTSARQARDNAVNLHGERALVAARAHYAYALSLRASKGPAEEELRSALNSYALLLPPDGMHPLSADARIALSDVIGERDRGSALRLAQQALTLREQMFDPADARVQLAREVVARLSTEQR